MALSNSHPRTSHDFLSNVVFYTVSKRERNNRIKATIAINSHQEEIHHRERDTDLKILQNYSERQ
jgi:hypothetical protein